MSLTQLQIKHAKPKGKPYKMGDSGGLYLLVTPTGGKLWRFKYRYLDKEKVLSLGKYPDLSLADAREFRDDARKLNAKGIDPNEHKKEQRRLAIQKDRDTFEHIAREWHERKCADRTPSYTKQVLQRLENDVFPKIGHRPISAITPRELLRMAQVIEDRGAIEMAHRAIAVCGQIFQYAIVTDRAESNPAQHLRGSLKTSKTKHHAHLSADDLPDFLRVLEAYQGSDQTKMALRLLLLTFVRTAELCGATWSEIDFEKKEWRIPAERMKMKTPHTVPLSKQTLEILAVLKKLSGKSAYVFPSMEGWRKPMSKNTMLYALYAMGYKGKATGHGFRATASTIFYESGLFEGDVIERQLAHQERNRVVAAYNHAQHLPARAKMMQWWADYLDKTALKSF
jgi:integrase